MTKFGHCLDQLQGNTICQQNTCVRASGVAIILYGLRLYRAFKGSACLGVVIYWLVIA